MIFNIGDETTIQVEFADLEGALADPNVVKLHIGYPSGEMAELVYGQDAGVIRTGEGKYEYCLSLLAGGMYRYHWVGSGSINAAQLGTIHVCHIGML
jgi:hypothetical protein